MANIAEHTCRVFPVEPASLPQAPGALAARSPSDTTLWCPLRAQGVFIRDSDDLRGPDYCMSVQTRLPANYPPLLEYAHLSLPLACYRDRRHNDSTWASIAPLMTAYRRRMAASPETTHTAGNFLLWETPCGCKHSKILVANH